VPRPARALCRRANIGRRLRVLGLSLQQGTTVKTYFCFIESDVLSIPHVEPLMAQTDTEALQEAAALLETHASGIAAHVLCGEDRIGTVRPAQAAPDDDPDETIRA